jgi:hypothetical protein
MNQSPGLRGLIYTPPSSHVGYGYALNFLATLEQLYIFNLYQFTRKKKKRGGIRPGVTEEGLIIVCVKLSLDDGTINA